MPNHPDLLSLVLTLRPLAPAEAPPHLGRAAHALLLRAIAWSRPGLAARLHDEQGPKPLTASSLAGLRRDRGLRPDWTYSLRFTALTAEVARALLLAARTPADPPHAEGSSGGEAEAAIEPAGRGPLAVGAQVELDGAALVVESLLPNPQSAIHNPQSDHPWAAATSYEALSAPWLLGRAAPDRQVTLEFASPTTFRSGGKNVPVPMPEWVFGSLLEKWNAYAPVALPEEVRRFAAECLALSRFELRTKGLPFKDGAIKMGAVGRVTYAALNPDRYWLSLIHLLAGFARFAGVGAGTSMGMGQCRPVTGRFDAPRTGC